MKLILLSQEYLLIKYLSRFITKVSTILGKSENIENLQSYISAKCDNLLMYIFVINQDRAEFLIFQADRSDRQVITTVHISSTPGLQTLLPSVLLDVDESGWYRWELITGGIQSNGEN